MAKIKVEEVVDHLDRDFTAALMDTFRHFAPDATVSSGSAFEYFKSRVYTHCRIWETVPDRYVETD